MSDTENKPEEVMDELRYTVLAEDGFWYCDLCGFATGHKEKARAHARSKHGLANIDQEKE